MFKLTSVEHGFLIIVQKVNVSILPDRRTQECKDVQSYLLRATFLGFVAPIGLLIYLFPSDVRPVDGVSDWVMTIGAVAIALLVWIYVTCGLLKAAVIDPLQKNVSKSMRRFLWAGFGVAVLLFNHAFIVLDTDEFSHLYWYAWLAINFTYAYIFLTKNLICGFCIACVLMPLTQDKFNLIMIGGLLASYLALLSRKRTGSDQADLNHPYP